MAKVLEKTFRVGPFVKEKREEMKISQREFGRLLGLQYGNFVGMLERGETKFPLDSWRQYAEVMEVDPAEFCLLCLEEIYPDIAEIIPEMAKIIKDREKQKENSTGGGKGSAPVKAAER